MFQNPNSGLRKFRHSESIVLSAKFIDGQLVDYTCDGRRVVAGRIRTLLRLLYLFQLHYFDLLWICREVVVQRVSAIVFKYFAYYVPR